MSKSKHSGSSTPLSDMKFAETTVSKKEAKQNRKKVKVGFIEKIIKHVFRKTYRKILSRGSAGSASFSQPKPLKLSPELERQLKELEGSDDSSMQTETTIEEKTSSSKKDFINRKDKELSKKTLKDEGIKPKSATDRFAKSGHLEEDEENLMGEYSKKDFINKKDKELSSKTLSDNGMKPKSATDRFAKSGHLEDNEISVEKEIGNTESSDEWTEEKEFEKRTKKVNNGRKK